MIDNKKKNVTGVFPKVLVLGQSFHHSTGGGVTLSNLFEGWDKNKLYSLPFGRDKVDFDLCSNVFILSYKSRFPFFFWPFVKNKTTDKIFENKYPIKSNHSISQESNNLSITRKFLFSIIELLGINHISHRYRLSQSLKTWLDSINPDLIHAQFAGYASMKFILCIQSYLGKPLIVHVLDNWVLTAPEHGIFKTFWRKRYVKLFIKLLSVSSQRIAISEEMALEYERQYGYNFSWIHNFIDITKWDKKKKLDNKKMNDFIIGYFGTITKKNLECFKDLIIAVKKMDSKQIIIRIFSRNISLLIEKYSDLDFVHFYDQVGFDDYKMELMSCSLLFLPLGFSNKTFLYTKLSFPTKLPEYMISKVPILVYARKESTLYKFCKKHKCAKLVGKQNIEILKKAITNLVVNSKYCENIISNAYLTAINEFSKPLMKSKFRKILHKALDYNE